MLYTFGLGLLSFIPTGANPTPLPVGVMQSVDLDIKSSLKKLMGQQVFAVDAAVSERSIDGKVTFGQMFGATTRSVLAGATSTTGSTRGAYNEVSVIPGTPYQVTVAQSATWVQDAAVYDVTAQQLLTRVASAPATGQYMVAAGVYTFATADTGHVVWINYSYTATGGFTTTYNNQLAGVGNTYQMLLFDQYVVQGVTKYEGFKLFSVVLPDLSFPFKNNDYMINNMSFTAMQNASGQILEQYTSE